MLTDQSRITFLLEAQSSQLTSCCRHLSLNIFIELLSNVSIKLPPLWTRSKLKIQVESELCEACIRWRAGLVHKISSTGTKLKYPGKLLGRPK